jgi:hypothetical protein
MGGGRVDTHNRPCTCEGDLPVAASVQRSKPFPKHRLPCAITEKASPSRWHGDASLPAHLERFTPQGSAFVVTRARRSAPFFDKASAGRQSSAIVHIAGKRLQGVTRTDGLILISFETFGLRVRQRCLRRTLGARTRP